MPVTQTPAKKIFHYTLVKSHTVFCAFRTACAHMRFQSSVVVQTLLHYSHKKNKTACSLHNKVRAPVLLTVTVHSYDCNHLCRHHQLPLAFLRFTHVGRSFKCPNGRKRYKVTPTRKHKAHTDDRQTQATALRRYEAAEFDDAISIAFFPLALALYNASSEARMSVSVDHPRQ